MGVLSNNYAQIVPGALISASYVSDIYEVLMGSEPEALKVTGSLTVTGSIIATTGVTASLQGTASYAVTASRAVSALTASYAISASYINYINSSSQSDTAISASYSSTSISASYAVTASYVANLVSSSFSISSSIADLAQTASYSLTSSYTPNYYSTVAFVDKTYGNDTTATIGNVSKPYLTVAAAIAAVTGSATSTSPQLVYLRAGNYAETITLKNHAHVYCEPGVMFTSYLSGFIDDPAGTTTKVFGYAKFDLDSKPISFQYASDIQFECDEIYGNSTSYFIIPIYIGSQTVTPKVRLFANKIYHNGKNGDCISLRYNFDVDINVKYEIRGLNKVVRFFSGAGKANITCPKIVSDASVYNSAWSFKSPIQCQSNQSTLKVIINSDLISEASTYSSQGCINSYQGSTARIELNGNIYATNSIGILSQNLSGTDYCTIIVNGNIYSNVVPVAANSNGIIVVNGNCIKTADVNYLYQAISLYGGSPYVYINNGYLYTNETNIDCINIASSTARLYLYDCKGYNNGTGYFVNSAATTPTVGFVNTKANGALSVNVTDSFSPTGFAQITGLVLPIF